MENLLKNYHASSSSDEECKKGGLLLDSESHGEKSDSQPEE